MGRTIAEFLTFFGHSRFRRETLIASATFAASVVISWISGLYATERASNFVSDIILSNTPVMNLSDLFVYGTVALIVLVILLLITDPQRIPFTLLALSVFYVIRSIFVSLTHLGPYPDYALDIGSVASKFFLGGDLFFSGHTGAPFLLALIFWHNKRLRILFLATSAAFGVIVLLGHLHYTIDVLSAFFITYSIYHITLWLFPDERRLFNEGLPAYENEDK